MLAPFPLVGVLMVASDPVIMKDQPTLLFVRVMVGLTTLLMFAAAIRLFAIQRSVYS